MALTASHIASFPLKLEGSLIIIIPHVSSSCGSIDFLLMHWFDENHSRRTPKSIVHFAASKFHQHSHERHQSALQLQLYDFSLLWNRCSFSFMMSRSLLCCAACAAVLWFGSALCLRAAMLFQYFHLDLRFRRTMTTCQFGCFHSSKCSFCAMKF